MKKITILLIMLFAAANVFAMTAQEVMLKAEAVNFLYSRQFSIGKTFVIELESFNESLQATGSSIFVIDGDRRREDQIVYPIVDSHGNVFASEMSTIRIMGEGAWITVKITMDGKVTTSTNYLPIGKDTPSKSEISQFNAQLSKASSIKFAKENTQNDIYYVVDVSIGEGLTMKLFINKKDFLIYEHRAIMGDDTTVIVFNEFKKVFENYSYPFIKEVASSRGKGVTTSKVTSFKVLKSKDVDSYFEIPKVGKTTTKTPANTIAISTDSAKPESNDGNFGTELGREAENTAKDEVKNQVKQGVKKGIGGILRGLGGF